MSESYGAPGNSIQQAEAQCQSDRIGQYYIPLAASGVGTQLPVDANSLKFVTSYPNSFAILTGYDY